MAIWTSKIKIEKNKINFNVNVEVYRDGVLFDQFPINNINPIESLYPFIKSRLELYKSVDETDTQSLEGDVVIPVPTQDELDQQAYFLKKGELAVLKNDLTLGLATQADYDAKLAEVINAKP